MIVPQDTIFPPSRKNADLETLYQAHDDDAVGELEPNNNKHSMENMTEYINNFIFSPKESWRDNWPLSYVLHGWTSAIKQYFDGDENTKDLFGEYNGITLVTSKRGIVTLRERCILRLRMRWRGGFWMNRNSHWDFQKVKASRI